MRFAALVLLSIASCSRPPAGDSVVVPPLPLPSTTAPRASPPVASSVAPSVAAPPSDLLLIGGDLVDLATVTVLRSLTTDVVFASAIADDVAYLCSRAATGSELRAYDAKSGALAWVHPMSNCFTLAASRHGAFVSDGGAAQLFDAHTGAPKPIGASTPVAGITELGGRFLVVHTDKRLESFDDTGALVGATVLPVLPDQNYPRGVLTPSGNVACGAQRSNVGSQAFCVDGSPRVVWNKLVAVPGGLLVQVDASAIVIASDTWTKSPVSSEVLRPSDGASLLRVSGVRLAAALTTGGVLDGALTAQPEVRLYDATASVKWTWPNRNHRDAMSAVRVGPNVALAIYSPIATGVELVALDAVTGKFAWVAAVDSLPISHSKYSNREELRSRARDLLLIGRESGQELVESFEPVSGVRFTSVVRAR